MFTLAPKIPNRHLHKTSQSNTFFLYYHLPCEFLYINSNTSTLKQETALVQLNHWTNNPRVRGVIPTENGNYVFRLPAKHCVLVVKMSRRSKCDETAIKKEHSRLR